MQEREKKMKKRKKVISYIVLCLLVPMVMIGGTLIFGSKRHAWISLCVAVLACVPFFIRFEKNQSDTKKSVLISAMVALSVIGRIAFSAIPGFKPVTAVVIITAMHFGGEAGFAVGALSALISNFYFGQGPWTPFQMFTWGIIGLLAGLISSALKESKITLSLYGILSGIMFSALMDVWSVLWTDGYFNLSRYFASIASALPFTFIYAVSNVVFLLLFSKPIGKILERIKTKYDIE